MPAESAIGEALCDSGLWLDLHGTVTYYSTGEKQALILSRIREALDSGAHERVFVEMAKSTPAAGKLAAFFSLGNAPRFKELAGKYLQGLAAGIEREQSKRRPIPVPADLETRVRETFAALSFFDPSDILEIHLAADEAQACVNYISRRYSPRYDGHEGPWDRDTQFKIELLFDSGLFVWLSANVSAEFRGRKMGTELIRNCEEAARNMGFRRFSVPGPNREFWAKLGYAVDPRQIIVIDPGHNPNLETYKEIY